MKTHLSLKPLHRCVGILKVPLFGSQLQHFWRAASDSVLLLLFRNGPRLTSLGSLVNQSEMPAPGLSTTKSESETRTASKVQCFVHVLRDQLAGLNALSKSSKTNIRVFIGFGVLGVVAQLAESVHMLFDDSVRDWSWYHLNYFHLFFLLGPHIAKLALLIGFYHLLPRGHAYGWFLVPAFGYSTGKIMWLISIDNNESFHSLVGYAFLGVGLLIAVVLMITMTYLNWRHYHNGVKAEQTFTGLYHACDLLNEEQFKASFKSTYESKVSFEKKF